MTWVFDMGNACVKNVARRKQEGGGGNGDRGVLRLLLIVKI